MSAAARVGGFYAQAVARAGGTSLQCAIARVVGQLVGLGDQGDGVYVSTSAIEDACFARGARSVSYAGEERAPAYGTVADVLRILRGIGVLTWDRAYNSRWHGPENADGWIRVELRDGEYRYPPRRLSLVGAAETIARASALVALPIDAVRSLAARCARALEAGKARSPRTLFTQDSTTAELPIGPAPSASVNAYSMLGRWRPPNDA